MGIKPGEAEGKYQHARDGDHLILPFQCELCHFRNCQGRDPVMKDAKDALCMMYIRRAILDSFWSRAPSTPKDVSATLRKVRLSSLKLGLYCMFPPMGPFPLEDSFGMQAALAVLDRSQDRTGKYEEYVQPNTYRKVQSALSNLYRSSVLGMGDRVGAGGASKMWMSTGPTHTCWFGRFLEGLKKRTGEVVRQDKVLSIDQLLGIQGVLEDKWNAATTPGELLTVSRAGAWFIGTFSVALRGEEVPMIELAGTHNSLVRLHSAVRPRPHFLFKLSGATKNDRSEGASINLPCVDETTTGLQPGLWVKRLCTQTLASGVTTGYLFSMRNGDRSPLSDFDVMFYGLLEELQGPPHNIIDTDVDIREEYGIWRTLRRSVTAHALNQQVDDLLVRTINRWRSDSASSRDMLEVYAEWEALLPTILRYSLAL